MRTKNEYMQELARHIRSLPEQDRRELLADYEEHFAMGLQNGKTEEAICRSLGTQEILMTTWVKQIDEKPSQMRSPSMLAHIMVMILVLAPLNFFMLLCPFLVLFCLVITGWTIPLTLGGTAMASLIFFWQQTGGEPISTLNGLSLICMFLGTMGLAALSALLMYLFTKGAFKLLIMFFKWNLDFINNRRAPAQVANGVNV